MNVRRNSYAFPINSQRQQRATRFRDRSLNTGASFGLNHERQAPAAACATDFAAQRALPPGGGNDAIDHRGGNRAKIPAAKLPLLPD
jgi:hypothetical protein